MVLFNYSTKELTAKVVYYGPGLCGKTTNLQYVHANLPGNVKGKMLSLATKTDRTLFFDFLPLDLGTIRGMKTRIQLYTVPGQVFYNETRKLVLKGADGIVFVADSQEQMLQANVESFRNLEENLKGHGMTLSEMPHVIQFNKRDLPRIASVEDMNAEINKYNAPFYESVATTGIGVQDTLKAITKLVLLHLTKKYDPKAGARATTAPSGGAPRPVAVPKVAPPPPREPDAPGIPLSADPMASVGAAPEAPDPTATIPFQDDAPSIPASPPKTAPPPPPKFHEAAKESEEVRAPKFDAGEIDEFMDDVEPADDLAAASARASEKRPELETIEPPPFVVEEEAAVPLAAAADTDADGGGSAEPDPQPWSAPGGADAGLQMSSTERPAAPPVGVVPSVTPVESAPEGVAPAAAHGEPDDVPMELTEAADDRSLFEDPSLDIARLAAGHAKEIVVPVELGDGPNVRRFKLSVTLRLDPVD